MAGRIVVFGATGYTGRLVSEALVERGARPTLAARNPSALGELASDLGGLDTQAADVGRPDTVRALVGEGDVLVSTVGPFNRFGGPAVEAAIANGAHYIDSTGESRFIRRVFEDWGPAAEGAGSGLITAFGYDFVPGNLAAALALEQAGEGAVAVDVGYFFTGGRASMRDTMSGGTAASAAGVALDRAYGFRGGRLVDERPARHVHSFTLGTKSLTGFSAGASEHLALPRAYPQLRDVGVYVGFLGPASRALQVMSLPTEIPGVRPLLKAAAGALVKGSTGGPGPEARAKSGSRVVAEARDATGELLASVELRGPNGYTFTGDVIAWGAAQAAAGALLGTGALGPVDAFGLRELEAGCAEAGLAVAR